MMSDEQTLLYERFRLSQDDDAFRALYEYYRPPLGQDGENLVDWTMWTFDLMEYDAEDIVADYWTSIVERLPVIRCFRTFIYQGIKWRVSNFKKKRRPGKHPWLAESNNLLAPGADPKPAVWLAEGTATVLDGRDRAAHLTHLIHLAALQIVIPLLPFEDQQAIRLYWLDDRTFEESAKAADMTFGKFRRREEKSRKHLRRRICDTTDGIETMAERDSLLMQWGDVRPDLHWVSDDKNVRCECSACKKHATRVVPAPHFFSRPMPVGVSAGRPTAGAIA